MGLVTDRRAFLKVGGTAIAGALGAVSTLGQEPEKEVFFEPRVSDLLFGTKPATLMEGSFLDFNHPDDLPGTYHKGGYLVLSPEAVNKVKEKTRYGVRLTDLTSFGPKLDNYINLVHQYRLPEIITKLSDKFKTFAQILDYCEKGAAAALIPAAENLGGAIGLALIVADELVKGVERFRGLDGAITVQGLLQSGHKGFLAHGLRYRNPEEIEEFLGFQISEGHGIPIWHLTYKLVS